MNKLFVFSILFALFFFNSCKDEIVDNPISYNIVGNVQKGPYSNGSELSIYELDKNLAPTGRTFHTTISDLGKFELNDVSLISPYVELVANGFYFNEVSGKLSSSPLTLRAIVSLTDLEKVNINLLTNIEYQRVKYLFDNEGKSFEEAKVQVQNEILTIFNMGNSIINHPERLDISQTSEGDAALLAVSVILQGNSSTAELSKLLNDIVTDLRTDGILNDTTLQNTIFTNASLLNFDTIKQNIKKQYQEFGITLDQLNNFDVKIQSFLKNSTFQFVSPFVFPESTSWGKNILFSSNRKFQLGLDNTATMAVEMPENGKVSVKFIIMEGIGHFYRLALQTNGWIEPSLYNEKEKSIIYTSTKNGSLIEAPFTFEGYCMCRLEIYFNDSKIPSIVKTITWGGLNKSDYYFAILPQYGTNLLAITDSTELKSDTTYIFAMESVKKEDYNVNFTLNIPSTANIEATGGWGNYSATHFTDKIEFNLKGPTETFVALKMKGEGTLNLTSDLQFKDGTFLKRTFFLKQ